MPSEPEAYDVRRSRGWRERADDQQRADREREFAGSVAAQKIDALRAELAALRAKVSAFEQLFRGLRGDGSGIEVINGNVLSLRKPPILADSQPKHQIITGVCIDGAAYTVDFAVFRVTAE